MHVHLLTLSDLNVGNAPNLMSKGTTLLILVATDKGCRKLHS